MATNFFARGAHTMNSMVFKSIGRKGYHKNSVETIRETMKLEAEEVTNKTTHNNNNNNNNNNIGDHSSHGNLWVPHGRTGIYYPKGHEKVMEDVPRPKPGNDVVSVYWVSYNDDL